MKRKPLVLSLALTLIVVSLSSAASTASASVSVPRPSLNAFWTGTAAVAQFCVPVYFDHGDGMTVVEPLTLLNFDGRNLIVTAIVAHRLNAPTAYLILGICFEGEDPVWVQEIQKPTYWGKFLFATAWAPLHNEWIKIDLSWVMMPPTFSTNEIASVLGGGGCARVFIYGGSWNYAQAYASVYICNNGFSGYSYDALVAHGTIDVELNAFAILG